MCGPLLQVASIAFSAMGAMSQAQGQRAQGAAQQQTYNYKAQVNENNKQISEWKAQDAVDRGNVREQEHRIKVANLKGRQRAVLAAMGVEVDTGSALEILEDTAQLGELDALTIRSNAEREAYDYKVAGMNDAAQADVNIMSGKNAMAAGRMGAQTSLMTGFGSVAQKWYEYT